MELPAAVQFLLHSIGVKINGIQIVKAFGISGAAIATVISRIAEALIVTLGAYVNKYQIAALSY